MTKATSNLKEVGAVTAVHYLLQGTIFVSSYYFQTLHLSPHLQDFNEEESHPTVLKQMICMFLLMKRRTIVLDEQSWKMKTVMNTHKNVV